MPTSAVNTHNAVSAQESQQASAQALDRLLDEYRSMSDSERVKGNFFESLVKQYFLHDSVMSRQFTDVFLWRDWPDR